jgi:hypothetical protein
VTDSQVGVLLEITDIELTNAVENEQSDLIVKFINPLKDYHEEVHLDLRLPS